MWGFKFPTSPIIYARSISILYADTGRNFRRGVSMIAYLEKVISCGTFAITLICNVITNVLVGSFSLVPVIVCSYVCPVLCFMVSTAIFLRFMLRASVQVLIRV